MYSRSGVEGPSYACSATPCDRKGRESVLAMATAMVDALGKDGFEPTSSADRHPVETLATDGADGVR